MSRDIYFQYLDNVVEVPGNGPVTSETSLVKLHKLHRDDPEQVRIGRATYGCSVDVVEPADVLNTIDFKNGQYINPTGVNISAFFNAVDVAPAMRLQMVLPKSSKNVGPKFIAAANIDLPFTGHKSMKNVQIEHGVGKHFYDIDLKFECHGAFIFDGMRDFMQHRDSFSSQDKKLVDFFYKMTMDDFKTCKVHLKLHQRREEQNQGRQEPPLCLNPTLAKIFSSCKYTVEDGSFYSRAWDVPPWKAFMTAQNYIYVDAGGSTSPHKLLKNTVPAPMMPFKAVDSFRSIEEARIKLAYGTKYEYWEDRIQLELLCDVEHEFSVWREGPTAVAVLKFGDFQRLSADSERAFRVANGTRVELTWTCSSSQDVQEAQGFVFTPSFPLGKHDMAVLIDSHTVRSFVSDAAATYKAFIKIEAHQTVKKQHINTIKFVTSPDCAEWHKYLLNQQPFKMPEVNACAEPPSLTPQASAEWKEMVDKAYQFVLDYKPTPDFEWNAEQMQVLQALQSYTGKIVLISGPPGTGKTTVLEVICAFFYKLGYHVIIDAPKHSNVEDIVMRLHAHFPELPITRLIPRSSEIGLTTLCTPQGQQVAQPDDFGDAHLYHELVAELEGHNDKFIGSKDMQLTQQFLADIADDTNAFLFRYNEREPMDVSHFVSVYGDDFEYDKFNEQIQLYDKRPKSKLRGALHQTLSAPIPDFVEVDALPDCDVQLPEGWVCKRRSPTGVNKRVVTYYISPDRKITTIHPWAMSREDLKSKSYDLFRELRKFRDRASETRLYNWRDSAGQEDTTALWCFKYAFKLYKKWKVAHARIICGTSALTNGEDVRNLYAAGRMGAPKSIGVVILKDEAAKETEPAFFGSIVHSAYRGLVKLVIACGDESQCPPEVNGSSGAVSFNMFHAQLGRSFFHRLIAQGHPHIMFVKQSRMHKTIAALPSMIMYRDKLQTTDERSRPLEADLPGLRTVMTPAFAKIAGTGNFLTDDQLRLHGFTVTGIIHKNENTSSRLNAEQAMFTLDRVVPIQQAYFKDKTEENCMIITGYGETVSFIEFEIFKRRAQSAPRLPRSNYPSVHTIDSSHGREAAWVVVLSTANDAISGRDLGFMKDNWRMNVAFTRATDILTYVHGPLQGLLRQKVKLDSTTNVFGSLLCCQAEYLETKKSNWVVQQPLHKLDEYPHRFKQAVEKGEEDKQSGETSVE
jgi:hypothetical protein